MEQIASLIGTYGVSAIIIVLFIWDWITNKKEMKETLTVIKDTSLNISKSLDLLQKSMDKHDEKLDELLNRERQSH